MTDIFQEFQSWDFPGGWVVKTVLPLQGSNPSWGTKIPHAAWCGQKKEKKKGFQDSPSGSVIENLPAKIGDTDSIPDPGRFHIATERLSRCTSNTEAAL